MGIIGQHPSPPLIQPMRKTISLLFFVLFLLTLPALIGSFSKAADASFVIGQIVLSLILLTLGLHFWKARATKSSD
jgi:ABC-type uncharacterized transport system permease subunit